MTLRLSPPPIKVPPEFGNNKSVAAFFNTLLNTLYQLWTAVYSLRQTGKVSTTDATVTSLMRVQVPLNKTVMIQANIVARRTGGSSGTNGDSAWYQLTGAYKNISGTLTGVGATGLIGGEDQAAWNVGFTNSGSDAVVIVTGAANNNISWEGSMEVFVVGA